MGFLWSKKEARTFFGENKREGSFGEDKRDREFFRSGEQRISLAYNRQNPTRVPQDHVKFGRSLRYKD